MLLAYPICIKINENNGIDYVYCPDLKIKIFDKLNHQINDIIQVLSMSKEALSDYIIYIQSRGEKVNLPTKLKEFTLNSQNSNNQVWTKIYLDIKLNDKGIFEKILPPVGVVMKLLAALSFSLTAILSMDISSGDQRAVGLTLGIGGAVIGISMGMLAYIYSQASRGAALFGRKIDNYFFKSKVNDELSDNVMLKYNIVKVNSYIASTAPSMKNKFIKIAAIGTLSALVLSDSISAGVVSYQTTNTLGDVAFKGGLPKELIIIASLVSSIVSGVSAGMFDAGFALTAVEYLEKKMLDNKLKNNLTNALEPTNLRDIHDQEMAQSEQPITQNPAYTI